MSENYKRYFRKYSLYSSISVDHMSDKTHKFCDLSLHSCNNGISFASSGNRPCGLGVSRYWWFMRFLFAWPTGVEQSLTITVSANKAFASTILKFSNDMSLPSFV